MKKCKRCELEKDLEEFRLKSDGKIQSSCRPCEREYLREYRKKNKERLRQYYRDYYHEAKQSPAWLEQRRESNKHAMRKLRASNPAREREYKRRQWAKLKADPKRYVQYLEDRRMYWHLAREKRGGELDGARTISTAKMSKYQQVRLPAGPLQEWIRDFGNIKKLAAIVDIHDRHLRTLMHQKYVSFDVADRILTREGSTAMHELWS